MAIYNGTSGSDHLQGGIEDDLLQGFEGNDTLDGGGGANTLEGGVGNDLYRVHSLADLVTDVGGEDTVMWDGAGLYQLGGDIENLVLTGTATQAAGNALDNVITADLDYVDGIAVNVDMGGGADIFTGWINDDTAFGGDGDDFMDGAGGGDRLHGGAGDDAIRGESFSFGSGWNDHLFGDAGDDVLFGFDGDDVLDGGDDSDIMLGYGGNDSYTGGAGGDFFQVLTGGYGGGEDVVFDFVDGEDRILMAYDGLTAPDMSDVQSIEPDGADTLITFVDAGTMRLIGVDAAGVDADDFYFFSDGYATDDTLDGSAGNDLLKGQGGQDRLSGQAGFDELHGGDGRDNLIGGRGADRLVGGEGRDRLTGGKDADVFAFRALDDGMDVITDFRAARGDVIDLSEIDARANKAGDQAFHFVDAFSGRSGEAVLTYLEGRDRTVLALDVDGDGSADMALKFAGYVTAADGWVL